MSHYEARLERDLGAVRQHMRRLSTVTRDAIDNALRSLFSGNRQLAYATILGDAWINERAREIDALCHRFIARHLPSAGHLRFTSAVIRTALQLERLGDYAVIIAREGVQLSAPPAGAAGRELEMLADQANRMLREAIDAFNDGNAEQARVAMGMGATMEQTMDGIYDELMSASDTSAVKDLMALFVVFSMVKRVSDQAKNICEETLFAATGEIKQAPVQNVLFVDEDSAWLSPMAKAVAEKNHPGAARFASAGREPAGAISPQLQSFLENLGFEVPLPTPTRFDSSAGGLSPYFVVVSLDGPIGRYAQRIPFHTSVLEWDLGEGPQGLEGEALEDRLRELYREIASRVRELVDTLRGEESA